MMHALWHTCLILFTCKFENSIQQLQNRRSSCRFQLVRDDAPKLNDAFASCSIL